MIESIGCQISCQITSAELAQVDNLLSRSGQTRSEWLHGLVQSALSNTPANVRNLTERVVALEQTTTSLKTLQKQVEHLTQQVADRSFRDTSSNVFRGSVSKGFIQASTQSIPSSPFTSTSDASGAEDRPKTVVSSVSTPSIYDVEEDEPDEILYDFLEPEQTSGSVPESSLSGNSIYDAEEDEPDEILYDFLEPDDR